MDFIITDSTDSRVSKLSDCEKKYLSSNTNKFKFYTTDNGWYPTFTKNKYRLHILNKIISLCSFSMYNKKKNLNQIDTLFLVEFNGDKHIIDAYTENLDLFKCISRTDYLKNSTDPVHSEQVETLDMIDKDYLILKVLKENSTEILFESVYAFNTFDLFSQISHSWNIISDQTSGITNLTMLEKDIFFSPYMKTEFYKVDDVYEPFITNKEMRDFILYQIIRDLYETKQIIQNKINVLNFSGDKHFVNAWKKTSDTSYLEIATPIEYPAFVELHNLLESCINEENVFLVLFKTNNMLNLSACFKERYSHIKQLF